MEPVRSFVAIELPDQIKDSLARLQGRLKAGAPPGAKWVAPHGIHLTLKFLGDIAPNRADEITRAMALAAGGIPPFELKLTGPGAFPNLRHVQVVWVGVGGEVDKLGQLQQRLESNLAKLGFAPESRGFTPHLTLARLRPQVPPDDQRRLGEAIAATAPAESPQFRVDAVSLMKSQLTREGAIYSRLGSVKLEEPLSTADA